ncbi:hypothetical protein ENSA7_44940 [Enhygromyxa salina]|uniref:Uncharacterized protein n=2 Tax=Enhygromyxa salina TaxID=215803 RepID=A0A2S9YKJ8_9BACT|nr:hypothetical protein ENSA7_44940 [Enhygromyxa salina]
MYNGSVLTSEKWSGGDTAGTVSRTLDSSVGQSINVSSTITYNGLVLTSQGGTRGDTAGRGTVSSEEDVWVVQGGWSVHGDGNGAWTMGQFVIAGTTCDMAAPQPYKWLLGEISTLLHEEGHQDQAFWLGGLYLPVAGILYGAAAAHHALDQIDPEPRGFLFPTNTLDSWANYWAGGH